MVQVSLGVGWNRACGENPHVRVLQKLVLGVFGNVFLAEPNLLLLCDQAIPSQQPGNKYL
jgi:hypothetical protein